MLKVSHLISLENQFMQVIILYQGHTKEFFHGAIIIMDHPRKVYVVVQPAHILQKKTIT